MIESADLKQLDEMAFVFADRSKPTLVLISVGSYRKRDELRAELDRLLPGYRSALLDLSGHPITSLFRAIRERAPAEVLNSRPVEYLLHIYGIEDSLLVSQEGKIAASSLIEELNLERENLFHEFPCCLILWTTPHLIEKLRNDAPDVWDWITYNFHFPDGHGDTVAYEIPQPQPVPDGVTEERKTRIADLEERLQRLRLDDDAPERVIRAKLSLHKALGAEYLAAFRYGDAIRCYTAALSLLSQTRHAKIDEAEIFYHLGTAHLSARHFAEALRSYEESLRIQEDAGQHHNIGGTWHQIGRVYEEQRIWHQALEIYRKALEWKEKTGQHHLMGSSWHQIGMVYQRQRNWPQALESYQKALEWKEKTGQHHEVGSTWHQIGMVYQEQRNWPQALESDQKALEWDEKTGRHHRLGSIWHQIGRVHEEQQEWPQALESYQKALEWNEKAGQLHQLGGTWHQIGIVYQEQRNWPQALESYQKALEWNEKTGQHHQLGGTWHQIGIVYEKQDDFSEALRNYLKALALCLENEMTEEVNVLLASLRRIFPRFSREEQERVKEALPEELYGLVTGGEE